MATKITEECINCGACEPECARILAIYSSGTSYEFMERHLTLSLRFYYIVPEKCTECVRSFRSGAMWRRFCPVDAVYRIQIM